MDKPIIAPITAAYTDGGDNTVFYAQEVLFSEDLVEAADYVEHGIEVVGTYVQTKAYFDEMLNDGNYLNDLQAYEDRILEYYNTAYALSETVVTDGIVNNLSAKEMEQLTIPLTLAVVYAEHNTQLITYYQQFRGDLTNAEVYNAIVAYLQPLQQGISRILAQSAVQVFTEGTDAYTDLQAWADAYKVVLIDAINSEIDLAVKISDANAVDASLETKITSGTALDSSLGVNITTGTTLNTTLVSTTTTANNTKTLLINANTTAGITLATLNTAIANGDLVAINQSIADINTLLQSDDIALDELQEIVTYIKSNKALLDGITGTNTGDETTESIKQKLGITTLSGSNTGDQDLTGLLPKSGGTMTGGLTVKGITETVYNLTGTAISASNGTIQYKVLNANTTFTESLSDGQSVTLRLQNGSSYIITYPTLTWVSSGGNIAPVLTANDVITFWKEGTTLYAKYGGSAV